MTESIRQSGIADAGAVAACRFWTTQRNYSYRTNTCTGVCGHYTPIVWSDTRESWLRVARDPVREVWYYPPGNWVGERPYRKAEPRQSPTQLAYNNVGAEKARAIAVRTFCIINAVDSLILDLLEWLANGEQGYTEVMDAWRTSCPRLPVWEDANDRGLVTTEDIDGRLVVRITAAGRTLLAERRSL